MSNVNYGTTPAEGASVAPALGSVNGSTAVSAGKRADLGGRGSQDDGFEPEAAMVVEPPRQEDLQRSYATIVDANANPKGWYGSMSKSFFSLSLSLSLAPSLSQLGARRVACASNPQEE